MEAVRESVSSAGAGQGTLSVLGRVGGLLRMLGSTAVDDAAAFGFFEAADFAGEVEELSRLVEYLQLVAAKAVDRTRNQGGFTAGSAGPSTGWVTGWGSPTDVVEPAATCWGSLTDSVEPAAGTIPGPADDGFRNTTEFLRARLRISAVEARRRLFLAESALPRPGFAGRQLPALRPELGAALAAGEFASRSGTIIALALDRVPNACDGKTTAGMEHALTRTAAENDPDFLARVARSWADALDQDGAEPSEEELRRLQGAFIRRARNGMHHLEVFATGEQFEQLLTVMNTATNPRAAAPAGATGGPCSDGPDTGTGTGDSHDDSPGDSDSSSDSSSGALDRRSRPQKLLDGLVGACKAALACGVLPVIGGLRPQVLATIDYRDLLAELGASGDGLGKAGVAAGAQGTTGTRTGPGRQGPGHTGTLMYTGPVTASTIRKIACDADIIPVLLGTEGRILDIGRASRVFPPHLRKAITVRDRGCAFPACTIPAPWCEAHHISYWSRGGTTGTDNGTLLCSHHHHLIHKEQWSIQVRTGIPWFIPPPHVDPRQKPQRNHYFRT